MRALIVTIGILLASACAGGPTGKPVAFHPASQVEGDFEALGTLVTHGNSVSYDDVRIVGPQVDVALQNEKEWAGSVYEHGVRLAIRNGELEGMGDRLVFTRDGDVVRVEGRWAYRRVRIEIARDHLVFRDGQRSYDLKMKGPGCLGDARTGCVLKVIGDAANLTDAMMPQFAVALIAAFPFTEER